MYEEEKNTYNHMDGNQNQEQERRQPQNWGYQPKEPGGRGPERREKKGGIAKKAAAVTAAASRSFSGVNGNLPTL